MALFGKEFKGDILKRKSEQQKFNENSRPGFFGDVRGTVPGKQGDARGPRLIPGASRGRTRPIFDGSMKLVIPRELNGKTQSPEVTKTTTEDRVPTSGQMPNFKDLPQNDGADQNLEIPRQNKTPRGMDEDPSQSGKRPPAHGDAVRGSGPSPGPWTAPLTGGVSGYQLGSRGKLDCGDESARDFRNSPEGYRCCIKSAKCFENLPDDIDDVSEASNQNADPATGNYSEACGKINESLVCMASVLGRDKCVSAAEIVNKDLREELVMVKDFHRRHCQGLTAGQSTVSSVPGGQGQMSTSGSSSLPTSAVIGAAIGGIFVLILIIAIVCFARRKKSSPPMQDKVAFHHSPEPSTRYKEFMRTNSEVYAEIDEKHLQRSFRASDDTTTFEKMEGSGGSTGSRPLPTAPSGGLDEDKAGYLTPKLSRENLNDKTGYDELSNVSINEGSCADSYDKLARTKTDYEPEAIDGDYITPESEPTEEKKNPENSHTYFVLEK
ncbi:uncharacterized protein LOC128161664 isoform X3 [Crassostrea angulata]|uniref:uncharacterized protein LOC128161664 isoform X3 n=1 Tax=Magallana angulata TaxID=2784310 RepID=UPI0022B1B01F|nr:uncharacterized protein LOC128161664 isoform X3 [Crassostrea angulata]